MTSGGPRTHPSSHGFPRAGEPSPNSPAADGLSGHRHYREWSGVSRKTFATIWARLSIGRSRSTSPEPDPGPIMGPNSGTKKGHKRRSLWGASWLVALDMHIRRSVHPLLLDPTYWRNRLRNLDLEHGDLVFRGRPDLSNRRTKVSEFQLRTHDGTLLNGLCCRPAWVPGRRPFRVRSVGPGQALTIDTATLEQGVAEFVFEQPSGRRLKDRVLDVVAVVRMAQQLRGIDAKRTNLGDAKGNHSGDEYLIAQHLFAWDLLTTLP